MSWREQAPSNVALIKYMGKLSSDNLPANSSLSYTLPHLYTMVELEESSEKDYWIPLENDALLPITMSVQAQNRFLDHLKTIKNHLGFQGHFKVSSANNFPQSCGIASSSSSFAALTLVACRAIASLKNIDMPNFETIIKLTRQGSGSACRSLIAPFALWEKESVIPPKTFYPSLKHLLIIITDQIKTVSSSEAHRRVRTSLLFSDRPKRAEIRLKDALHALAYGDWKLLFTTCWQEFWDMHALFLTSNPPFGYMTEHSLKILNILLEHWQEYDDGPIVTLDAGANIHLLFREDQNALATYFQYYFSETYQVLSDEHAL